MNSKRSARQGGFLLGLAASAIGALAASVNAQETYPNKPIRVVVQFGPGSSPDVTGRIYAEFMTPILGSSVIIENRPGASGQIGLQAVKQAPPDGYTVLYGGQTSITILPGLDPKLGNPLTELRVVGMGTKQDLIVTASPAAGIRSMKDLADKLVSSGEFVTFVTSGVGTPVDIVSRWIASVMVPGKATGVNYQNSLRQAAGDMATGRVGYSVTSLAAAAPLLSDGKIVGIAVMGPKRLKHAPTIPTITEAGFPQALQINWSSWFPWLVPIKTPESIVEKINATLRRAGTDKTVSERTEKVGHENIADISAAEAAAFVEKERNAWKGVVDNLGLKAP